MVTLSAAPSSPKPPSTPAPAQVVAVAPVQPSTPVSKPLLYEVVYCRGHAFAPDNTIDDGEGV